MSCVFQNIDPSPPLRPASVSPPAFGVGGGNTNTRRVERGVGGQDFGRRKTHLYRILFASKEPSPAEVYWYTYVPIEAAANLFIFFSRAEPAQLPADKRRRRRRCKRRPRVGGAAAV
jgi:hypothetical protein